MVIAAERKRTATAHVVLALDKRNPELVGAHQRAKGGVEVTRSLAFAHVDDGEAWVKFSSCGDELDVVGQPAAISRPESMYPVFGHAEELCGSGSHRGRCVSGLRIDAEPAAFEEKKRVNGVYELFDQGSGGAALLVS